GTKMDAISIERLKQVKFNVTGLRDVLFAQEFNYHNAGEWTDQHIIFVFQAIVAYLVGIFMTQRMMRKRGPFSLKMPLAAWNGVIAAVSGICALAMMPEYFTTLYERGVKDTLCWSQNEYFGGQWIGRAAFILILARLTELIDTAFIVLRKQPLIFLHWYHHTLTLGVSWYTYSGQFSATVHLILLNAMIHTVMYSYYFLTAIGVRPHPFVAQSITIGQILQFFYTMYGLIYVGVFKFILGGECKIDAWPFFIHCFMVVSYTYLFVDFYLNKYSGVKAARAEEKKHLAEKIAEKKID
ncbi:hypothetical protein PMAYCL1PPCAC_16764, partial [Pristionchus mayeri]